MFLMNRWYFTLLFLLFFSSSFYAQRDFRVGYIVTNEKDTVYGKIDYRKDLLMSTNCRFRVGEGDVRDYSPNDISAFRFVSGKFYVAKEVDGRKRFLEYLIEGKISIYYLRGSTGDHYFIEKDGEDLQEISYEEGIRDIDGRTVFYQSKRHVGILNYYILDVPNLKPKVNGMRRPERKNLIKLAESYHNAVCEGEKCVIYAKNDPLLHVNIEAVSGVIRYGYKSVKDRYYWQNGVIVHFLASRTNEKIFLKAGVLYSQPEDSETSESLGHLYIPVHIGYLAPHTYKVRPSVSLSLLSPSYLLVCCLS